MTKLIKQIRKYVGLSQIEMANKILNKGLKEEKKWML